MTEGTRRRLAAIVSADVVGYSRLMGADETGTLPALRAHRAELIDRQISEHGGRIVKSMGDGLLLEFTSVMDAVRCCATVQRAMARRNATAADGLQMIFRMGVNLGDIIIDGEDIHGDGVNVAARLEAMSDPGGLCVSDVVYQSIKGKTELGFADMGEQSLKNIDTPIRVWRWDVEPASISQPTAAVDAAADPAAQQQVKFRTAPDGVSLAYAVVGEGPPLVKAPNWLHNIEFEWQSPVWGHLLRALAKDHTLVRFDQRANGLSDWDVPEITFDAMVDDLAAVIDAAGLARFSLLGVSQGCASAVA
jgi:class 3 adenylate cyclase